MSEEEMEEYHNDRTKLLCDDSSEPTRKLHGEIDRFIYPQSDSETNHNDFELCERRQPRNLHDSDMDINEQLSSNDRSESKFRLFQAIPRRFIILVLITLANFNMYCIRMCLNVTIVAMTRGEGKQYNSTGPHLSRDMEPEFHWDKQFQGTILASLYWSYTAMQIPAGLLCVQYGGTFLLGFAIFGSSLFTLATPFIVRQNVYAFIFVRIMEGAFLGLVATSGISLFSKWSPIYERSIFMMVGCSGYLWGTVFANSMSGVLAGSYWGWPSVFYFFGVQGILWYFCWIYFVYEDPKDHPNITKAELNLIGKHWNKKLSFRDIPWRYILTSVRVWAIIIPNFTDCWSFYTFMISFPGYLKDVLNLDITTIGFTSSLPYVLSAVLTPCWGYFIDVLRSKKYISTTNSRKLSHIVGAGLSAIFIAAMAYASTATSAIVIATIAITLTNFTTSGPPTSLVELAPKYSGVLMGFANFACNITGFITPEVVGALTVHGDIRHQWGRVFYVCAGINIIGMLFYLTFGSSEKQAWAEH
ncbi:vesicular glutamate transporter 1-like [Dendronephthya gigantea]|uniref:vesicular glutamate transporter 1-like n=1 Tax=Dendronephthya gigantea TaxID=151771 RepID=UPI00106C0076|nr:vesicular glutamate transporter 1-like [Dendronephthya gigantea]XP_028408996.1 vesicular glutamate transporter 1-like [Dendronephthya gigantea]XP_028409067.1 vesicular glutamate transporter 1-like [Dendronephthya gigantea]